MKKSRGGIKAVVVGLALLTLQALPAAAAERAGYETYVVRKGDTLSRISGRVYGDVKRWREILKENPQVTDPNRIYPGDTLMVPVPATAGSGADAGVADAGSAAASSETAAAPAATGEQGAASAFSSPEAAAESGPETVVAAEPQVAEAPAEPPREHVRPTAVVSPALYRSAGHIADRLPALAIVASQDDRIILGSGDAAIINAPVTPGTRFTVVRADRRVFHPRTGANLGWLIRVIGAAEVTCRDQRTSTVALVAMSDSASVGDYLLPIDPDDVLEENALAASAKPGCVPAGACDGVIVAFNEEHRTAGEQELAYIDRGTAAGVAPGQRFTIYREVAPEGRVTVGEIQVLRAGAHTSTVLITNSIQEVQVGYLLRAR